MDAGRNRDDRHAEWWSAFAQDFRYAVRGLRLKPWFAVAVILTLGLGIGANATMFGIVDRLLFRPPRYLVGADRTGRVFIPRTFRGKENDNSFFSYRRYLDLRNNTTSFDGMTPFYSRRLPIGVGEATRLMSVAVSDADLWRMFDVKPVIGRFFTDAEAKPATPGFVLVISYAYWQTNYGGRNDALGETVNVGPDKYTIIGVAPDGFTGFTSDPVIGFISTAANSNSRGNGGMIGARAWWDTYNSTWFEVYARRKPNVTPAHADADLTQAHVLSYKTQASEQATATPLAIARPRGFLAPTLRARGPDSSSESKVVTWLGGVALIVLLIACANVANLLVARALRRQREIAVRLALGVSRARLLMQLAMESSLLAVIGGAFGLLIAQWGGVAVRRVLLDQTSSSATLADPRLLVFVGVLTIATSILTGLAPVAQARRTDIASALKAGVREGTVHRSGLRIGLLVGASGAVGRPADRRRPVRPESRQRQERSSRLRGRTSVAARDQPARREARLDRAEGAHGATRRSGQNNPRRDLRVARAHAPLLLELAAEAVRAGDRLGVEGRRLPASSRFPDDFRDDGDAHSARTRFHRRGSRELAARGGRQRADGAKALAG